MRIDSPRFGPLDVEPAKTIEFPRGLPGFEGLRRFSLFHPEGAALKYFILQSLDDPEVAFYVTDPAELGFGYEIALTDEEAGTIGLADPAQAAVVVMLIKDDAGRLRANLNAPLILNTTTRRGLQHVFATLNFDIKPA